MDKESTLLIYHNKKYHDILNSKHFLHVKKELLLQLILSLDEIVCIDVNHKKIKKNMIIDIQKILNILDNILV